MDGIQEAEVLRHGGPETSPVRPVWAALEEADTATERIHKVIGALEERLSTVVSPRAADTATPAVELVSGSQLEARIRGVGVKVLEAEARVRVLLEDLGL